MTVTALRREPAAPETPAAATRREHEQKLADIDHRLGEIDEDYQQRGVAPPPVPTPGPEPTQG